jgi:chromosome segregation ATPase
LAQAEVLQVLHSFVGPITMKAALIAVTATSSLAASVNPIEKVIQMMSDLEQKIIGEGKDSQKVYDEFAEWCEDRSKDLGFEIKTGKAAVADLSATIEDMDAKIAAATSKIEDLSSDISSDEADLKAATTIRKKEATDFAAEEKELNEVIDMLQRAVAILEKEMAGGASMMQLKSASNLEQALDVMVKASAISSADSQRLVAMVQTSNDDADSETGAPEAAAYENKSGGIVDTLNGLLEKAEGQLDEATKEETAAKNKFDLLKQSLTDEIKYANKDMDETKKSLAESTETKAAAEGDLKVTSKDLSEDVAALGDLHQDCMTKAQDFEAETNSRGEELKALAMAKKAVKDNTGGAFEQSSFLQLSSSSDLKNFEVVRMVKDLARKQHAPALAQLASRLASAIRLNHGEDVFAKIKAMISDMVEKLEQEAAEAAELKQWCDKEISEATAKKEDSTATFEKLTTSIDSKSAKSKKLKEQVATLQKELAELAETQQEMDKVREEEKAIYEKNKPEVEQGLKGIKLALKILNDYYAKGAALIQSDKADGAGGGIIGMLEVIESDFTKALTEMVAAEQTAAASYEKESQENEIEKTTKTQDVKYKTKEAASLDKTVSELSSDRDSVQSELDAVNEYLESLDKKCTYKVESYEERKARREAEINGLKEALDILESESALVQTSSSHALRGVKKHA